MNIQKLSGRVAVVTGASRGLGKQMAESLAHAGASVALVARDPERLEAIKTGIEQAGGQAECYVLDVTDERNVASIAGQIRERLGAARHPIKNAGVIISKPVSDCTLPEWNHVISTNLNGPFLCARAFIPGMKEEKFGRILNLPSFLTSPCLAWRHTLPLIATDMNKPAMEDPSASAEFLARIPLRRWGTVKDVGPLAVYLCSDAAGFIAATDIVIDGGWTAE